MISELTGQLKQSSRIYTWKIRDGNFNGIQPVISAMYEYEHCIGIVEVT